jgi:hypothetical protein
MIRTGLIISSIAWFVWALVAPAGVLGRLLAIAAALALIPAEIAHRKGRGFLDWWIGGFLLWIVAFPAALLASDQSKYRCPFCAEDVRWEAEICPHCRRELPEPGVASG